MSNPAFFSYPGILHPLMFPFEGRGRKHTICNRGRSAMLNLCYQIVSFLLQNEKGRNFGEQ